MSMLSDREDQTDGEDSLAGTSRIEWATLAVALTIYCGFAALTWFHASLPLYLTAPLVAVLLAWYGSLQHETIHDHPTPWRRLNALVASLPLSLWIPYGIYRDTHLRHHEHRGRHLTDPALDPESFYQQPGTVSRRGRLMRTLLRANTTLGGRMLVGPLLAMYALWAPEIARLRAGDHTHAPIWARHVLGVTTVLVWVVGICHIPAWGYLALMVYPSISLGQLRSFAEHRAHADPHQRTTVVEAHPVLALIFLNNNLHIAHHAHPELPWYRLPDAWNRMRRAKADSGLIFAGGYGQIVRGYLFRPVISIEHPLPRSAE
jgi:fatty acid desaturase